MSTDDATPGEQGATPRPSRVGEFIAGALIFSVGLAMMGSYFMAGYLAVRWFLGDGWFAAAGGLAVVALVILMALNEGLAWKLFVWAIRAVICALGVGMAGAFAVMFWYEAGWIGAVIGLAIGAGLFLGVIFVGMRLVLYAILAPIWLIGYVLSVGPWDFEEAGDATKPKRPEGDQPADELLPAPGHPPLYRPIVIIAIALALWVHYGWPALQGAREWEDQIMIAILPLGFIGLAGRHLPTLLLRRRDHREARRRGIEVVLASPDGKGSMIDPFIEMTDLSADRSPGLPDFLRRGPGGRG